MLPPKAQQLLRKRETLGGLRSLTVFPEKGVDFLSNDYLGLAKELKNFIPEQSHGGATGSRLISGNSLFCEKAEKELAHWYEAEAALLFNSGYTANLALVSSVPQRGDLILYDELIHASLREGIRLSMAKSYSFKHNNTSDLLKKAKKTQGAVFVVVESIYSMDGDTSPADWARLCKEQSFYFILDEAHSTGIMGEKGKGFFKQIGAENIFARVHTFGKGMGAHGAVVVGSKELKKYLINFARPFIYTTGMADSEIEAILKAHDLSKKAEAKREKLNQNITYFKHKMSQLKLNKYFIDSDSPIQAFLHRKEVLEQIIKALEKKGIYVKSIASPTVPVGKERIRIVLHSFNSEAEITDLLNSIKQKLE